MRCFFTKICKSGGKYSLYFSQKLDYFIYRLIKSDLWFPKFIIKMDVAFLFSHRILTGIELCECAYFLEKVRVKK